MALNFSGIENVEFYSGHYLDAVLEGDLADLFRRWSTAEKEGGPRAPWKALEALANPWFKQREAASQERDPETRWQQARTFHVQLLESLGYTYPGHPGGEPLDDGTTLPTLISLERAQQPFLWVLDTGFPDVRGAEEDVDPLDDKPLMAQLTGAPLDDPNAAPPDRTWRELLDETIFRQDDAPQWVLFLSGAEALLAERNKWMQGRLLRFSFDELFTRKDTAALKAVCGLLHKDVLAPESGLCLHDTLDENSHKHAFAVSGDLKHGVRRAIELLANEAIWHRREVQKQELYQDKERAQKLTEDCLTFIYRLLFLFCVEARSEDLNVVPMRSELYRRGYSLECLRELELTNLTTDQARNGFFLHDSLKQLFALLQDGFPHKDDKPQDVVPELLGEADLFVHGMEIPALRSPLFDDSRLHILGKVRFRNRILQHVLQLLSLSAEKKGSRRGRISYAQLGISQLGAVYESLLSYTGFFAGDDLYEVANKKDNEKNTGSREDLKSWFVPKERIGEYEDGEIVKEATGKPVVHEKGTYLFRLAGRNREKSASYYTPEVLTKCLVKYSLKELLEEEDEDGNRKPKLTADEILGLTICEPAMGSGAFLLEAVDQLADAYLTRKQKELDQQIPPDEYQREKRRVKARLATNNCHGVDLNPVAVELAKVSLWLGTMHEGGKCPWFGLRLAGGNSLIGARRQVYSKDAITRKGSKDHPNWLGLVPDTVPLTDEPGEVVSSFTLKPRPKDTIYHFLLPADGMAAFDTDKVLRQLEPESCKRIKAWRKEITKPFSRDDADRLVELSDAVDRLWAQVVGERALATRETSDRMPVWPDAPLMLDSKLEVRDQETVAQALEESSSAYRRLKLVMDVWCSLWFWPIEKSDLLPDRKLWLRVLELVLKGEVKTEQQQGLLFEGLISQSATTAGESLSTSAGETPSATAMVAKAETGTATRMQRLKEIAEAFRARRGRMAEDCGVADVEQIIATEPMLGVAEAVAAHVRFHHWELRFAEVFAEGGGFDLVLGNPPWILISFDEKGVLSEFQPALSTRSLSASRVSQMRSESLEGNPARQAFAQEFEEQTGIQSFLGHRQNQPLLLGMKTNTYKCFVTQAWALASVRGVAG